MEKTNVCGSLPDVIWRFNPDYEKGFMLELARHWNVFGRS